jgi:hypothetical protein
MGFIGDIAGRLRSARVRSGNGPDSAGSGQRLASVRRAEGLLHVAQRNLPREVESSGAFDDWAVAGPAFVAIVTDLVEGVMAAPPPRGRIRAEVLARSLCEYAITFAWLAGVDDQAERSKRLQSVVKDEFQRRSRAQNQLTDQIAGKSIYGKRRGAALLERLLDEETEARLVRLEADASIPRRPNVLEAAARADEHWMPIEEPIERVPFALLYLLMFTDHSFTTHATVTALSRVVSGVPPHLTVGHVELMGDADGPYGLALIALTNTLIVASHAIGWPDRQVIDLALER